MINRFECLWHVFVSVVVIYKFQQFIGDLCKGTFAGQSPGLLLSSATLGRSHIAPEGLRLLVCNTGNKIRSWFSREPAHQAHLELVRNVFLSSIPALVKHQP
jgi:hypothetical protein